jgi:hypothetical protein
MHNTRSVQGRQRCDDLLDQREAVGHAQPAGALDSLPQAFAAQILQANEEQFFGAAFLNRAPVEVKYSADVRVANLAGQMNFPLKSGKRARVQQDFRSQGLECNLLAQLQVYRLVNLSHAAAGDKASDPKAIGKHLPGKQSTS